MSIYRQVIDGVIVNRIVGGDTKDVGGGLPVDFPDRDTYELETENPPPQIGWVSDGQGSYREPPSDEPEEDVPIVNPFEERLAALEDELAELRKTRA